MIDHTIHGLRALFPPLLLLSGWILFAPLVAATPFTWEHLVEQHNALHVIALTIVAGLSVQQLQQLIARYTDQTLDPRAPMLPKLPHEQEDETFDEYIKDFLQSPFLSHQLGPNDTLEEFVRTKLRNPDWMVPEHQILSRKQREGVSRRLLAALDRFWTTLHALLETQQNLENTTTKLREEANEKQTLEDRLNEFGFEMNLPRSAWSMSTRDIIQSYLAPMKTLFEPTPNMLSPFIVQQRIQDELNALGKEIPDQFQEKDANGRTLIVNSIQKLRTAVRRMTSHMSGVQPTGSGLPNLTLHAIWDALPTDVTDNTAMPTNENEMEQFLSQLAPASKGKAPAGITRCTHPQELAQTLHTDQNKPWAESLDEVTRLYNLSRDPSQGRAPIIVPAVQEESLFRASEVPEFKDRHAYWSYRSSLNRFKSGMIVPDSKRGLALNRILSRFTGTDVSDAANRWNLEPLINANPTWDEIYNAFLQELDRRFLPPDFAKQQEIKFRGLRVKDKEPQDFINDFETQVRTTQEALQLSNIAPLENGEIMRQLMSVIPGEVREKVYDNYQYPELQNFFEIAPRIIRWWKNIYKPREQKKGSHSSKSAQHSSDAKQPSPNSSWNLPCNKPCWDTEPAVPNGYRGKFRDNNGNIKRGLQDHCAKCRRPRSEHGGNLVGCAHHGDHSWDTHRQPAPETRSSAALPPLKDSGDN